jgi:hypothetical protein
MKNIILFSTAIVLMLITACSPQNLITPVQPTEIVEQSSTQLPVVIPTETPNSLGKVKVYHDENAGFALEYPATWQLEDSALQGVAESAVYTVSLFSWDRATYTPEPKDQNSIPDGAVKIDITVFNQGASTLEAAVSQFKNQDGGTTVNFLKEENWTLNNGEKAVYIETDGPFGVVATLITLVNNKVIYVSGYGNLTPFPAIVSTLRTE